MSMAYAPSSKTAREVVGEDVKQEVQPQENLNITLKLKKKERENK